MSQRTPAELMTSIAHDVWQYLPRNADAAERRTAAFRALEAIARQGANLAPVRALEEHLGSGWAYGTEVIIDAPMEELRRLPGALGRLAAILAQVAAIIRDSAALVKTTSLRTMRASKCSRER